MPSLFLICPLMCYLFFDEVGGEKSSKMPALCPCFNSCSEVSPPRRRQDYLTCLRALLNWRDSFSPSSSCCPGGLLGGQEGLWVGWEEKMKSWVSPSHWSAAKMWTLLVDVLICETVDLIDWQICDHAAQNSCVELILRAIKTLLLWAASPGVLSA